MAKELYRVYTLLHGALKAHKGSNLTCRAQVWFEAGTAEDQQKLLRRASKAMAAEHGLINATGARLGA